MQEAKDAGIPVILVDRRVAAENDSLITACVGSDFDKEGSVAVEWNIIPFRSLTSPGA